MKILITGSGGVLGSSLLLMNLYKVIGFTSKKLDVTNFQSVSRVLKKENPDVIIHTAAYTDVEGCEIHRDKAYQVNTLGTQNLVNCCIESKVLFIYISSTGIYGNQKKLEPYDEFDDVKPTTIHHKTKNEAEKIIQHHLSKYLILRTGWLFGGAKSSNKNFVYKRYLEAINNKVIYSDGTQIGSPTYVCDLVEQIQVLIESNQRGIFNCVNKNGGVSRYEYVKEIIKLFNLDCKVKKAKPRTFNRVAKVSRNESAVNYKLDFLDINVMRDWRLALKEYILKFSKNDL